MNIPIIKNGGVICLKFANGHTQRIQIFHNAPGKSKYDSVYGLRSVLQKQSLGCRPDVGVAGHTHRAGIAKEYAPSISLKKGFAPQAIITINTGTTKGSNPSIPPDRFGIKISQSWADPLGQGFITQPRFRKSGHRLKTIFPFISLNHGETAFNAMLLLNALEQQHLTSEILEKIADKIEKKPEITFVSRSSKKINRPYSEIAPPNKNEEDKASRVWSNSQLSPQYAIAKFDIKTQLPIAIDFISNIRIGAKSEGTQAIEKYMRKRFTDNPHAFIAFLRNLVDMDISRDPERKQFLDKLINLGVQYPEQVLILLLDANLRARGWKKRIGDDYNSGPIPAGTYLAKGLGAKLIAHQSTVELAIGPGKEIKEKPVYRILILDKLGRHGSSNRPTFGHQRIYNLYTQHKPGAIVGGHLTHSGISAHYDRTNDETNTPHFIQPGWWATSTDALGKGNAGPGAIPGQALILLPGKTPKDYLAFATADAEETECLHQALTLWVGANLLGIKNQLL